MEFRLTYEGLLFPTKKERRPDHKHDIRKAFHKQLARLWRLNPYLSVARAVTFVKGDLKTAYDAAFQRMRPLVQVGFYPPGIAYPIKEEVEAAMNGMWKTGEQSLLDYLANNFQRCGYRFVPLVRGDLSLITSIHILFLRPDVPGSLIRSGDIDNRLLTIFDALKMPESKDDLAGATPAPDEDPFFVLLQDDKLITNLSVETDMLLEPTGAEWDDNDSRLIITVKIRPYDINPANERFG
jgi:hypothetical protein